MTSPLEFLVYRTFSDGTDEIGVMTFENGHMWIHVGDFDYCLSLSRFPQEFPFEIWGIL